jgi:Neutral/alkaline non-lysosomal ceramidase, N-terminal
MKKTVCLLSILFGFSIGFSSYAEAADPTWKVGLAQESITPSEPVWMAGYSGRNRPSEGKLQDIWVKAVALEGADGHKAIWVEAEILNFPRLIYSEIVRQAKEKYNIEPADLMLTSTHTHSAPVIWGFVDIIYDINDEQRAVIRRYGEQLISKTVDCIGRALDDLKPATLWAGEGEAYFAANRRHNPWGAVVDKLRAEGKLKGPSDLSVPVLAIRNLDGTLRGVVSGYAAHCVVLCDNYDISGDWAGFAQVDFQKSHPGVQLMVYQGCGADQNAAPRLGLEATRKYGAQFAEAVDKVLSKPMRPIEPKLKTDIRYISIPFGPALTREELQASLDKPGLKGRWARRHLADLEAGKTWPRSYDAYPVQVWRLGEKQLWIALGGEVVVDYALKFKKEFGPDCWVCGYTNDCSMGYIPTTVIQNSSRKYETGAFHMYGLPAHDWASGIEDRITENVRSMVKEIKK